MTNLIWPKLTVGLGWKQRWLTWSDLSSQWVWGENKGDFKLKPKTLAQQQGCFVIVGTTKFYFLFFVFFEQVSIINTFVQNDLNHVLQCPFLELFLTFKGSQPSKTCFAQTLSDSCHNKWAPPLNLSFSQKIVSLDSQNSSEKWGWKMSSSFFLLFLF